jgi:hypothetical protein
MKVSHTVAALSVSFDEENLVSPTGLVPVMRLAENAGLHALADEWLSIPTDYPEDSVIPSCACHARPGADEGAYSSG